MKRSEEKGGSSGVGAEAQRSRPPHLSEALPPSPARAGWRPVDRDMSWALLPLGAFLEAGRVSESPQKLMRLIWAGAELVVLIIRLWDWVGSACSCDGPVHPAQQMDVGNMLCGSKRGLDQTLQTECTCVWHIWGFAAGGHHAVHPVGEGDVCLIPVCGQCCCPLRHQSLMALYPLH